MTSAARISDLSAHGGMLSGPGVVTVLIGGLPAAVAGDTHSCSLIPHAVTPIAKGSTSVFIGGRPALRAGDLSGCGAPIIGGLPTVQIGG